MAVNPVVVLDFVVYTRTRFGQRFSVCMTNGAYERKSLALSHAHA